MLLKTLLNKAKREAWEATDTIGGALLARGGGGGGGGGKKKKKETREGPRQSEGKRAKREGGGWARKDLQK